MRKNIIVTFIFYGLFSTLQAATLSLNDGWNLVSIPTESNISKSSLTLNDIGTFNGTAPIPSFLINEIEASKGYWLNSSGNSEITYTELSSINIPVMQTGWNLVGFPSYTDVTSFQTALTECGYSYSDIGTFNGTAPIPSFLISSIDKQKGYWINITSVDATAYAQCIATTTPVVAQTGFNTTTGVFQKVVSYDGVTPTTTSVTLPVGIFDIYAEYTGTNSRSKQNIDSAIKYDDNTTVPSGLISGSSQTTDTAPAHLRLENNTGTSKTYQIDVSQIALDNTALSGEIWLGIIDNNTSSVYTTDGNLTLGNVETNIGQIFTASEDNIWSFETNSTGVGTYDFTVTTDINSTVNPLQNFQTSIKKLGNGQVVANSNIITTNGSVTTAVSLDNSTSYQVIITSETTKADLLGSYKIKLIKNN